MAGKSNYFENLLLNAVFNGGSISGITPYISLHQGDPTDAGTGGAEVTTSVRAAGRVSGASKFAAPVNNAGANTVTNSDVIDFGPSDLAVSGITHFGVWDAASGGNLLYVGTISGAPVSTQQGGQTRFQAGQLTISED